MNISMKKQYVLITLCVLAADAVLYSGHEEGYPVYNEEELLKTDVYPFTFVFFGDNRPSSGKEEPEVFKTIIQMINEDDPLFVVGGGDFVIEGTPENFEAFLNVVSALEPP